MLQKRKGMVLKKVLCTYHKQGWDVNQSEDRCCLPQRQAISTSESYNIPEKEYFDSSVNEAISCAVIGNFLLIP